MISIISLRRRPTEVVEHCCSITSLQLGETMSGISRDMDTLSFRVPLGVTAGITPFNFPAMIPLWVRERGGRGRGAEGRGMQDGEELETLALWAGWCTACRL